MAVPDEPEDQRQADSRPGLLDSFLGERYRTWEWKDSLGCVWFVALGVVITIAIGLSQLGVPSRVLQVGTIAVLVALIVVLWLIGRSGKSDA